MGPKCIHFSCYTVITWYYSQKILVFQTLHFETLELGLMKKKYKLIISGVTLNSKRRKEWKTIEQSGKKGEKCH